MPVLKQAFLSQFIPLIPGIEAGAQLIIKDQLTASAGGLYLDGIYANVRVGWLMK